MERRGEVPPEVQEAAAGETSYHPGYYSAVLNAVREAYPTDPSKEEKVKGVLDAVDRQLVDNFEVYDSELFPGVSGTVSKISLAKLANDVFGYERSVDDSVPQRTYHIKTNPGVEGSETSEYSPARKRIFVLFSPFTPPPGGEPQGLANNIYGRVFEQLPQVAGRTRDGVLPPVEEVELYAFGTLTSPWSRVSKEFVEGIEEGLGEAEESEHGFTQHGKVFAEYLKKVLPKDPEEKKEVSVLLHGGSMGSILADVTSMQLLDYGGRIKRLIDSPTAVHTPTGKTVTLPRIGKVPLSAKGAQVLAGFGAEAGIRMQVDPVLKTSMKEAKGNLTEVLKRRGIFPHDTAGDTSLKQEELEVEIKTLGKGTKLHDGEYRTYQLEAFLDPATVPISEVPGRIIDNVRGAIPYPKTTRTASGEPTNARKLVQRLRGGGKFETRKEKTLVGHRKGSHWIDRGNYPEKFVEAVERCESLSSV